jgi:hypothetical protein
VPGAFELQALFWLNGLFCAKVVSNLAEENLVHGLNSADNLYRVGTALCWSLVLIISSNTRRSD